MAIQLCTHPVSSAGNLSANVARAYTYAYTCMDRQTSDNNMKMKGGWEGGEEEREEGRKGEREGVSEGGREGENEHGVLLL